MIRRGSNGRLTFVLSLDRAAGPISVVGDFNGWDPLANPLLKRSNGTRSATVVVEPGTIYRFRYLCAAGTFFDDEDADAVEPNGYGQTHSLVSA